MRRLYNVRHVRVCYVEQSEASQCERTEKFCYKKPERATMLEAMSIGDVYGRCRTRFQDGRASHNKLTATVSYLCGHRLRDYRDVLLRLG